MLPTRYLHQHSNNFHSTNIVDPTKANSSTGAQINLSRRQILKGGDVRKLYLQPIMPILASSDSFLVTTIIASHFDNCLNHVLLLCQRYHIWMWTFLNNQTTDGYTQHLFKWEVCHQWTTCVISTPESFCSSCHYMHSAHLWVFQKSIWMWFS